MKKLITITSILILLVSTFAVGSVLAATEGQTSTSILVQNLSTSNASIMVDFYDTGGTNTGSKTVADLCGECSTTFDQRYDSGNPGTDPFQGGAVVLADQPIGAVVQEVRSGGSAGVNSYESYNGIAQAAQNFKAPLILRGINSAGKEWNTVMAIQNTNSGAVANVTVTFTPDPAVGLGNAHVATNAIAAGGVWYLRQQDQTELGAPFFGSAVIESADQDVAVVVNSGTTDGAGLIAYPTFNSGSAAVYLPGAMKNIPSLGDNYFTSLTIVNMGTGPVDVTVEYQALSGTAGTPYVVSVETAKTIDQRYDANISSDAFFGAIKLTTSGGPIAAMLNMRGDSLTTGAMNFASTYGGFAGGMTTAYAPYLLKSISSAGYSWSTSVLIQNLDPASGPLTVNITYNEDPAFGSDSYLSSKVVDTFDFVDLRSDVGLVEPTFYGSAKLEASGPFGIVVLVRGNGGMGDALSSYLGMAP